MKREIKFRGFVEKINDIGIDVPHEGHFLYGDLVHGNDFDYIVGGLIEASEEHAALALEWWQNIQQGAAEQFTGLKDANGKEIYEGDVLQPVISYTKRNIGKPFEVKRGNYVYGKWIAKDVSSKGFGVDGYYFSNEMRLIGNVHDNLELLGADK